MFSSARKLCLQHSRIIIKFCSTWRPVLSATSTIGMGTGWLGASLSELRLLLLLDDASPSPLSNRRRLAPVPAAGELKRSAAEGDIPALLLGTNSANTINTVLAISLCIQISDNYTTYVFQMPDPSAASQTCNRQYNQNLYLNSFRVPHTVRHIYTYTSFLFLELLQAKLAQKKITIRNC